jgi:S1-C subfamily serine protease
VTNCHVVDTTNERTMVVMTADSHVYPVQRVLAASPADDLAILQVDARGLQPLPLADGADAAPVASAVSVIGYPDGRFFCYTSGGISQYMKIPAGGRSVDAVAITAEYARGSSGAPVLDSQGQVVAVVSSTLASGFVRAK